MSHRKFSDRQGRRWQVKVTSKADWLFEPIMGNPGPARRGEPPHYAGDDPFELSELELQSILGDASPTESGPKASPFGHDDRTPGKKSPFLDDYETPKKKSPFLDDREAPAKKSPFRDD